MLAIEGYLSLFCVQDLTGDVVRVGLLRGRWRASAGVEAAELGEDMLFDLELGRAACGAGGQV